MDLSYGAACSATDHTIHYGRLDTLDATGYAEVKFPLPFDPSLLGGQFFSQYAVITPVNLLNIAFTNGRVGTIGSF